MNEPLLLAAPLMIAAIVMAVRFVGCGIDADPIDGYYPGDPSEDNPPKPVAVNADFTGHGVLSAQAGFPSDLTEDPKTYGTTGTYTYPIPYWCTTIDLILLGAGGGGGYGANDEAGGAAGGWDTKTLQRGSDIPWEATTITVTVGQGGAGGSLSAPQGGPGGDTTASWDSASGPTTKTATGGPAAGASGISGEGPSPSSESIGTASLAAGAQQSTEGADGNGPGGGGAGGAGLRHGGAGADGAAVVHASQS
jgi:hypothetical protein